MKGKVEGWKVEKLTDVFELRPPKKEARERLSENDLVSFLPMEDLDVFQRDVIALKEKTLKEVSGSYTYFANNDVLLAKITPCFENGKLGIARNLKNGIGFGSSEYIVFRSKGEVIPEFLFYYLAHDEFRKKGEKAMTGAAGQKRVSPKFIESLEFAYPPLPEQQRIVSLLDETFAALAQVHANAERNLVNAREVFESVLNETFNHSKSNWIEINLGEICQFENGDRGKNYPNREEYVDEGIPWINTGHIQPNGTLSQTDMNYITKEKFDTLRSGKIQSGDLVYCLRGATLGKTAIVDPYTIGAVASSLVIIRPSEKINSRFLYYYLTSPYGQGLIKLYDNGAAQPNLGARSVEKYKIFLPPLEEQRAIIQRLDALAGETQRLEAVYQSKLEAVGELRRSVLQKAFEGGL